MRIKAIVGKSTIANNNNRIYPRDILKKSIEVFKSSNKDIYLYPSFETDMSDITNVMGLLKDIHLDDSGNLYADIEILPSKENLFNMLLKTNHVIVMNFEGRESRYGKHNIIEECYFDTLAFTDNPSWRDCEIESIDGEPVDSKESMWDIIKFYF